MSLASEESGETHEDDTHLGGQVTRGDEVGTNIKVCRGKEARQKYYIVQWRDGGDPEPQYPEDVDFKIEYPEAGGPARPWKDTATRAKSPPPQAVW